MIAYEAALQQVFENTALLGQEHVPLAEALGRVLAEAVRAPWDFPQFDNAAVDGYGVRLADLAQATADSPAVLPVSDQIPAGHAPTEPLAVGTAVRILTGAPVPAGVEAVVMQENTARSNGVVQVFQAARAGENIRCRGEAFHAGDTILTAGTRLTPGGIGLLASMGMTGVSVFHRPRVALIITGSELVPPGQPLGPGQIYESNAMALTAALQALGLRDITVSNVPDDPAATRESLTHAFQSAEVVITSGGVSVGDYDHVKDALGTLGVLQHFWGVAVKPGKPVYFGTLAANGSEPAKLVFGLPGNPAAVLLTFYFLVRPALLAMMGLPKASPAMMPATLTHPVHKKPGRRAWIHGTLATTASGDWSLTPSPGQGSHMLGGLATADGILHVPEATTHLADGEHVLVTPLVWGIV